MSLWETVISHISSSTGLSFELADYRDAAGGCINQAAVATARDGRRYFVKFNAAARRSMFEAEAELARAQATRVPQPICVGSGAGQAFLVLEYLDLRRPDSSTDESLGRKLAALHRVTQNRFGWHRDNSIGSTPQLNQWCDDWVEFYRERRLRFQLELAAERGGGNLHRLGENLCEYLPCFFETCRPLPSLLHGDLWGGNVAVTSNNEPVIFDPAVYFGDREADLAMTELFGGFSENFYRAYHDVWPLDPGYRTRKSLYNLYHVLNHFNLFGGGYSAQAECMMQKLLNEVR